MPPIQIVQGPNGEPLDANTGFIVLDPQQGIEQDPLTGIIVNMSLQEFATPEGQPLDPQQAIAMIEQARQAQGGGMPQQGGGMPPQGGAPMTPPMPPPMPQAAPGQSFDPSTGMMLDDNSGLPVDPNTGMLVDPSTGQQIDPNTGMPAQAPVGDMPFTEDPEIQAQLSDSMKRSEKLEKSVSTLSRNMNLPHDLQGVRVKSPV